MKKYLQRLLAGLAALPLAAQCLAPVATEASLITVEFRTSNLTQISSARYDSNWTQLVDAGLASCADKSCTINMTTLYEAAIANADAYAALVEQLFAAVENENLSYSNYVFTMTGSIPDLHCLLANAEGVTVQEQLAALAQSYAGTEDVTALQNMDATALESPCTLEIRADFSNVGTNGAVGLSYTVTTNDGSYTLLGENSIFAHLAEVYADYTSAIVAATAAGSEELQADVDAVLTGYAEVLERLQVSGTVLDQELCVSGESFADVLAQLETSYPDYAGMIPVSAESAATIFEGSWNSVMTQVNENIMPDGLKLNLDIYETAAIFDGLTDVTLSLEDGTATLVGTLADTQTADVLNYYAADPAALATLAQTAADAGMDDETGLNAYTEGVELIDTAKIVEAAFPVSILESGTGEIRYQIYRTYTFTEAELPEETTAPETETTVTETTAPETETTVTETTAPETETETETTVTETTAPETETKTETTVTETTTSETETAAEDDEDDEEKKKARKHRNRRRHEQHWRGRRCGGFFLKNFGCFRTDFPFNDHHQPEKQESAAEEQLPPAEQEKPCERPTECPNMCPEESIAKTEQPVSEQTCKDLEQLNETFKQMIPWQK